MKNKSYYLINSITFYRLIAAPFLILLILKEQIDLFKWFLVVSFFTDLIDGYLARSYKTTSILGAKLDSVADDFTILAAMIGMFFLKREFFNSELFLIIGLLGLFVIQNTIALIKYKKTTSFHTYFAKVAAILQGLFFIFLFLLSVPPYILFYLAIIFTAIDLLEEIILTIYLPDWKVNVKGLYWVMTNKK